MEDLKVTATGYDFKPARAAMQRYIDNNLLSGISWAVMAGRDLVDVNCVGFADKEAQTPLRTDHIFRVFSNTKLVTSCAALLLMEEGKFKLDDPIEKYIPQLGNRKVLRKDAASIDDTEPARSSITIRQLLSHSAGLSYGFFDPGTVIFKALNERGVHNPMTTLAQMVDVLGELPLIYQPGTSWEYSLAIDVIARLIEVISGQSYDAFIKARIFDPLGMVDTGFFVTEPERLARLAQPLPNDSDFRVGRQYRVEVAQKWFSASGGMVSTMADFSRFAQMLLNGGTFDGKTYLNPKTFEMMATDYVGKDSGVERDYFYFPGDGFGMGLGLAVRTDPGNAKPPPPGSLGELKWDGASGCYMVLDRKQEMMFVLLEQTPTERQRVQRTLKQLVYEALEN